MNVMAVIPARLASTRLEAKVLLDIAGKPMIQYVFESVKESSLIDGIVIACDDERVMKVVQDFGAKAVMTSKDHLSGSDRIAEVVRDEDVDIVVNVQGDEPLIEAGAIDDLVRAITSDENCPMATLIKPIEDSNDIDNPNVVKVIVDCQGDAIYFSRSRIPFNRGTNSGVYYKHLGIYIYRKEFLMKYISLPVSVLEQTESLEQLRVIEAGYKIKTVITTMEIIGVDTREDLERVKKEIENRKG